MGNWESWMRRGGAFEETIAAIEDARGHLFGDDQSAGRLL